VVIIASGAGNAPPNCIPRPEPHVTTQSKLEAALAGGALPDELASKPDPTVVMIQCVETATNRTHCSRVCCSEAVKNALEIKRRLPRANVIVLGRDIRTYGFRELFFQEAREKGVLFVRHPDKMDPVAVEEGGRLKVTVHDSSSNRGLVLRPDLLVLSTGIAPAAGNPVLSGLLRAAH
jgi:heterodisulfide reductase subunit A